MFDCVTGNYTGGLKEYISDRRRVCKDLHHWNFLTKEEQNRFSKAKNELEVDRLLATARTRAYNEMLRAQ